MTTTITLRLRERERERDSFSYAGWPSFSPFQRRHRHPHGYTSRTARAPRATPKAKPIDPEPRQDGQSRLDKMDRVDYAFHHSLRRLMAHTACAAGAGSCRSLLFRTVLSDLDGRPIATLHSGE